MYVFVGSSRAAFYWKQENGIAHEDVVHARRPSDVTGLTAPLTLVIGDDARQKDVDEVTEAVDAINGGA